MDDTKQEVMQFPQDFPIKVMGAAHPGFPATVLGVVREHAPDTAEEHVRRRDSAKGNYLSVTVTVNAQSREQLDNIYHALTAHPDVKLVL